MIEGIHEMTGGFSSRPLNDMQYRLIERGESSDPWRRRYRNIQRHDNTFVRVLRCPECGCTPCGCMLREYLAENPEPEAEKEYKYVPKPVRKKLVVPRPGVEVLTIPETYSGRLLVKMYELTESLPGEYIGQRDYTEGELKELEDAKR